MARRLLIFVFLLLNLGCGFDKVSEEDFCEKTWIADDGARVVLKKDSLAILQNFDFSKVFDFQEETDNIKTLNGKWSFKQKKGNPCISIRAERYGFDMYLKGAGIFEKSKPYDFLYT